MEWLFYCQKIKSAILFHSVHAQYNVAINTKIINFIMYRPKLSSMVAYKHPSVLPVRESEIQNLNLYVGKPLVLS